MYILKGITKYMTSHLAWLDMQLDLNNLKFVDCMQCKFDVKFFVTKELKNIVVDR
jgi:hypothetical protein